MSEMAKGKPKPTEADRRAAAKANAEFLKGFGLQHEGWETTLYEYEWHAQPLVESRGAAIRQGTFWMDAPDSAVIPNPVGTPIYLNLRKPALADETARGEAMMSMTKNGPVYQITPSPKSVMGFAHNATNSMIDAEKTQVTKSHVYVEFYVHPGVDLLFGSGDMAYKIEYAVYRRVLGTEPYTPKEA